MWSYECKKTCGRICIKNTWSYMYKKMCGRICIKQH